MLDVRQITKRYQGDAVLDRVSLALDHDEAVAVLGPSGSGKTTLLRVIAGLEYPDEGEIWIDRERVSAPGWASAPHTRRIGFVFQNPTLWPHMTVAENVRFGLATLGKAEQKQRVEHALESAGVARFADRYPNELSGGEARRVAVARALAPRPRLLLMDEPLVNLDEALKDCLLKTIDEHRREHPCALVYVTHDRDEAARLARRTFGLVAGREVVRV